MPGYAQTIGATLPKTGALQYESKRLQGVPLIIPANAGVTATSPGHIVTLQQDPNRNLWAVLGWQPYVASAYVTYVIVGVGILEESLQSNVNGNIAAAPNTYATGTQVTVLQDLNGVCAVEFETGFQPANGVATATVNTAGQVSSKAADSTHTATKGAVFTAKRSLEMAGALKPGFVYFQLASLVRL